MKRITPLKAKKNPSEMERYAKERAARKTKPAAIIETLHEPMYDPESDLHYLARAEEVRSNPARHKAAKQVAKRKIHNLSKIA